MKILRSKLRGISFLRHGLVLSVTVLATGSLPGRAARLVWEKWVLSDQYLAEILTASKFGSFLFIPHPQP